MFDVLKKIKKLRKCCETYSQTDLLCRKRNKRNKYNFVKIIYSYESITYAVEVSKMIVNIISKSRLETVTRSNFKQ